MTAWKRREVIGDCVLYLGDCLEVMPALGKVDAVMTDPPFDQKTHDGAVGIEINFAPVEDVETLTNALLSASRGWVLAFCSFEMLGAYAKASGDCWIRSGVWDKISNMPQMTGDRPAQGGEAVAIMHPKGRKIWFGGGKAAIWRHLVERGQKQHPTQKPVALISELLEQFSAPAQVILDPFMGSGTTLVACAKLGRKGIGIELDPDYFDIACRRVEAAYRQPDLFIPAPAPKPEQTGMDL